MKRFFSRNVILILLLFTSCDNFKNSKESSLKIQIGKIETIDSKILNDKIEFWVSVPNHLNPTSSNLSGTLPVMYLLDGDSHFNSTVGIIDELSSGANDLTCPNMIVVGIKNINRTLNLTPCVDSSFDPVSGGSKQFLEFIEKELFPFIEDKYHPAKYRMLVGHSLGGLTVINTLLEHSSMFNSYVAIDPSLWWNKCYILKDKTIDLLDDSLKNKSLYISIANTMGTDLAVDEIEIDTSAASLHTRAILSFIRILEKDSSLNLNYDWGYYSQESHNSIHLISVYDALRSIFKDYEFTDYALLYNDSISPDSIRNIISGHFNKISEIYNYNALPPETLINSIAYDFMNESKMDKAKCLFEWNIKLYPESSNVYDSMGDYYARSNNNSMASKYYKKALEINERHDSREKLEKLN